MENRKATIIATVVMAVIVLAVIVTAIIFAAKGKQGEPTDTLPEPVVAATESVTQTETEPEETVTIGSAETETEPVSDETVSEETVAHSGEIYLDIGKPNHNGHDDNPGIVGDVSIIPGVKEETVE